MAIKTHDADISVVGKVTQTGTPSSAGDLTTKAYVDAIPTATSVKRIGVRAGSITNVTRASQSNGVSFGGVTLATGDLFFLGGQTTASENGIYVAQASGAPVRHTDFDASGELVPGTQVFIREGTLVGSTQIASAVGATPWVPDSSTSTWVTNYSVGGTDVSVADGGTGRSTSTTAYGLIAAGTTATGAHQTLAAGATTTILVGGGASALPVWTTATGTGAPVRATSPALVTPTGIVKGDVGLGNVDNTSNVTERAATATLTNKTLGTGTVIPVELFVALSDETTAITTGNGKVSMRAPWAFTVTSVRASLTTASSSGIPTVDINESGVSILSTKLTIDASERTSTTAATAAVISDAAIADDAELTFDIDVAGTGATGLKVLIKGTRVI